MEGFIRFIPIILGFQLFQPYKVMQDFATIHSIIPQFATIPTSPVDQYLKPKTNCWIFSYFCWSSWCLESSLSNMIYPARLRLETQTKWYIYLVGKGPKTDLKLKMQQETGYIWLLRWWIASMRLIIILPRTKCHNSGLNHEENHPFPNTPGVMARRGPALVPADTSQFCQFWNHRWLNWKSSVNHLLIA